MSQDLLKLEKVRTYFPIYKGILFRKRVATVRAVDGVSLSVRQGETLGLVGESGCGKSTLARSIMQLIRPTDGRVLFDGRDMGQLSGEGLRRARLDFQMVFQDPFASLNPRLNIFETLLEALQQRGPVPRSERTKRVGELMERVGLHPRYMMRHPHQFSGGQRQRVAIARALAPKPKLLVADEPVSSLDVSVQSQILNLLARLKKEEGLTLIFVSHDLSVVRHLADRVAVMYLGKIVELGDAKEVFRNPLHLYTKTLISAIPQPDPEAAGEKRIVLLGEPPSPSNPPPGCAFAWRSPKTVAPEVAATPGSFREVKPGHWVEVHPATVEDYDALMRS